MNAPAPRGARRSPVPLPRRAVLGLLAAGAAGLTAGALGVLGPLRARVFGPGPLGPADAPTGVIGADLLRTLLAAARAIVDEQIEDEHYAAFFRWRAQHLRGHRALYERFCAAVDGVAKRSHGREFAQNEVAIRRRILEPAFEIRAASAAPRWRGGWAERDWQLYDRHIVQEVLALFARTDVWVLLGYQRWPGTPRGLEQYQQSPQTHA